ncbi:MAG: Eco57I restriction-modification methylase domain-containing protein [Saprospiraceae bacterium]|nr:Eco57I restriction-modification methylase domain-containing protein [Saprospiraceae bacterium]
MFGVKDGFDIVIGNPPYVQLQKLLNSKQYATCGYETYSKSSDLYCLFYEKGIQLLKPNGVLNFITSNSWMRTKYGFAMRKYLQIIQILFN